MKKDIIFAPVMMLIAIMLFLHSATGLAAHITISLIGVPVLSVYTSATRKEWKTPTLSIVHKAGAALFAVLLVVLFVVK